jgi:hypothetical protein
MKGINMKFIRNLNRSLLLGGLALAAAGLVSLPLAGLAQAEKGASKLMWTQPGTPASYSPAPAVVSGSAMSCPMCKTRQSVVVEKSFKATVPDTRTTVTETQCGSCATRIVTQGGKRDSKVERVCSEMGSMKASCCGSPSTAASK